MRSLIQSVWETLEPLAQRQHLSLPIRDENLSGLEQINPVFTECFSICLITALNTAPSTIRVVVNLLPSENSPAGSILLTRALAFRTSDLPYVLSDSIGAIQHECGSQYP